MNTLLFSACGFALLSFFKSGENERCPLAVLKENAWVFLGVFLFSTLSFLLRAFFKLQILETELLLTVVFFILTRVFRQRISIFAAVSGLSFWVLEYDSFWIRASIGALAACSLYAAFRFALWSFQNRSLFYKPLPFLAGHCLLIVQSFWSSVILTVLAILLT